MTKLDDLIKNARKVAAAATKGPWNVDAVDDISSSEGDITFATSSHGKHREDAEFIALAANSFETLLMIIEIQDAALARVEGGLTIYKHKVDQNYSSGPIPFSKEILATPETETARQARR